MATIAKLRPWSPAAAASIEALSASRCERSEMSLTVVMISPIARVFSASSTIVDGDGLSLVANQAHRPNCAVDRGRYRRWWSARSPAPRRSAPGRDG